MDVFTETSQPKDVCRCCGKERGNLDTKYRVVVVEVKPLLYEGFPVLIGLDKVITDDNVVIKEHVCPDCIGAIEDEIYSYDEGGEDE